MKRPVSDPGNPGIASLMVRSGFARMMLQSRGPMTKLQMLRAFRREVDFAERQRIIAQLRDIAPLGVGAYAVRMGRAHSEARL